MAHFFTFPPLPTALSGSGNAIPHSPIWFQGAAATGVCCIERLVAATMRCRWRHLSGLQAGLYHPRVIFCIWHNRLAFSMIVHRKFPRPLTALVSASKDGAMLAAVLNALGVGQVRGSTSRRGPQALLELTKFPARGCDLARCEFILHKPIFVARNAGEPEREDLRSRLQGNPACRDR